MQQCFYLGKNSINKLSLTKVYQFLKNWEILT